MKVVSCFLFSALVGTLLAACPRPEDENMTDEAFAAKMKPLFEMGIKHVLERNKMMKMGTTYTEADLQKIDKDGGWNLDQLPHLKEFMKKAAPLRIRLLNAMMKEDVTNRDELRTLAVELAKLHKEHATYEVKKDFLKGKMLVSPDDIEILKDVAADTAALTAELTDKTGMDGYPLSNSTFVKALSKKGNQKLYAVAGYMRCLYDSYTQFTPKREERLGLAPSCDYVCAEQKRKDWYDHCKDWKDGRRSEFEMAMEIVANDLFHICATERGAYAFLEDSSIYVDTLKKIATFNSAEEFVTAMMSKSPRWKAAITMGREILKCKYNALGLQERHSWKETADAGFAVLKRLFEDPQPDSGEVARQAISFITEHITVKNFLHLVCMVTGGDFAGFRMFDSVEECFTPAEPSEFARGLMVDLRNTPESKAHFLEQIKPKSEVLHAFYDIVFQIMANLMSRDVISDATKQMIWEPMIFATTVSRQIPDYPSKFVEVIARFHERFTNLPADERKQLIEHYPLGSLQLLAMAF